MIAGLNDCGPDKGSVEQLSSDFSAIAPVSNQTQDPLRPFFELEFQAYVQAVSMGSARFGHVTPSTGWIAEMRRQLARMIGSDEKLTDLLHRTEQSYYALQAKDVEGILRRNNPKELDEFKKALSGDFYNHVPLADYLFTTYHEIRRNPEFQKFKEDQELIERTQERVPALPIVQLSISGVSDKAECLGWYRKHLTPDEFQSALLNKNVACEKAHFEEYQAHYEKLNKILDSYKNALAEAAISRRNDLLLKQQRAWDALGIPDKTRLTPRELALLAPGRTPAFGDYRLSHYERAEIYQAVENYIQKLEREHRPASDYLDEWLAYTSIKRHNLETAADSRWAHLIGLDLVQKKYNLTDEQLFEPVNRWLQMKREDREAAQDRAWATKHPIQNALLDTGKSVIDIPIGISRGVGNVALSSYYDYKALTDSKFDEDKFFSSLKNCPWCMMNPELSDAQAWGLFFESSSLPLLFVGGGATKTGTQTLLSQIRNQGMKRVLGETLGAQAIKEAGVGALKLGATAGAVAVAETGLQRELMPEMAAGKVVGEVLWDNFKKDLGMFALYHVGGKGIGKLFGATPETLFQRGMLWSIQSQTAQGIGTSLATGYEEWKSAFSGTKPFKEMDIATREKFLEGVSSALLLSMGALRPFEGKQLKDVPLSPQMKEIVTRLRTDILRMDENEIKANLIDRMVVQALSELKDRMKAAGEIPIPANTFLEEMKLRNGLNTALRRLLPESFFVEDVSPVKADSPDPYSRISEHPAFQRWFATTKDPNASYAKDLAVQLTWGEARVIDAFGGVSYFQGTQGCCHHCLGCMVRCDKRNRIIHESWEDFETSVRRLKGLETALKEITGKGYNLIYSEEAAPHRDSDPMNHRFKTKDGETKTIVDMMRLLHEVGGARSYIWTAGWKPQDLVLQRAAEKLAKDISMTGRSDYLKYIQFEIKVMTEGFVGEVERYMRPIVEADPVFMEAYGEDFHKYGFGFSKYKNSADAVRRYNELVLNNYEALVATSKHLQDRIANVKLLLEAINQNDKSSVVFYGFDSPWERPDRLGAVFPFLEDPKRLATHINEKYLEGKLAPDRIITDTWIFDLTLDNPIEKAPWATTVTAYVNGTIRIETDNSKVYHMTESSDPHIRSLAFRPVLFEDNRPAWEAAKDHLDETQENALSERERASIGDRIKTEYPFQRDALVVVDRDVQYMELDGRTTPVVSVIIANKKYLFDFKTGTIRNSSLQ